MKVKASWIQFKIVFISIFLFATSLLGADHKIASFDEIREELLLSSDTTLVVLDVDEVIMTTKDHFMHPDSDVGFYPLIQKAFAQAVTQEEKKIIEQKLSLLMLLPEKVLIEENLPTLIRTLQDKGIAVIALTSCPTGPFGIIPKVEKWRLDHLKSLGIDFSSTFPYIDRTELTSIQVLGKKAPLFEKGILFSKGYTKGQVLKAFISLSNFRPERVIFVDDLAENLESVASELASLGIEFKGYQYTGASRFFKQLDVAVLEHQFNVLMEEGVWLSDEEVIEQLK